MLQRPKYAYLDERGMLALAAGPQTIHVWKTAFDRHPGVGESVPSSKPDLIFETPGSPLAGMAFLDETTLVTTHAMGEVRALALESIKDVSSRPTTRWEVDFRTGISAFAVHRCRHGERLWIAMGNESGHVFLLELHRNEKPRIARGRGHRDAVVCLAFSGDDERMASSSRDRTIQIWATNIEFDSDGTPQELVPFRKLEGSGGWPLSMAFSHDHNQLVSGGMDNGVYLWDLEATKPLQFLSTEHHGWLSAVTFFEDDRRIASASWDNTIGIFETDRLKPLLRMSYHKDYVSSLLLSTSTSRLFAGSYDGTISAWDIDEGQLLGCLKGHSDWVLELVWLKSGQFISISSDRTARLWNAEELRCLTLFAEHEDTSFELGGSMGWKDFGLGGLSIPVDTAAIKDELDSLHGRLVRRYSPGEQENAAGKDHTVMDLLDKIGDEAADLLPEEPEEVEEVQDAWMEGWQQSHPDSAPEERSEEKDEDEDEEKDEEKEEDAAEGISISSLVLDAISEAKDSSLSEPSAPEPESEPEPEPESEPEPEPESEPEPARAVSVDAIADLSEIDIMDSVFDPLTDYQPPEPSSEVAPPESETTKPVQDVDALDEPIPIVGRMDVSGWVPDEEEFDQAFSDSVASIIENSSESEVEPEPEPEPEPPSKEASPTDELAPPTAPALQRLDEATSPAPRMSSNDAPDVRPKKSPRKESFSDRPRTGGSLAARLRAQRPELREKLATVTPIPSDAVSITH
ncbi:MAG: WD40 repeat domain-containing protein, partial [Bradymonadaceae bacterium]